MPFRPTSQRNRLHILAVVIFRLFCIHISRFMHEYIEVTHSRALNAVNSCLQCKATTVAQLLQQTEFMRSHYFAALKYTMNEHKDQSDIFSLFTSLLFGVRSFDPVSTRRTTTANISNEQIALQLQLNLDVQCAFFVFRGVRGWKFIARYLIYTFISRTESLNYEKYSRDFFSRRFFE